MVGAIARNCQNCGDGTHQQCFSCSTVLSEPELCPAKAASVTSATVPPPGLDRASSCSSDASTASNFGFAQRDFQAQSLTSREQLLALVRAVAPDEPKKGELLLTLGRLFDALTAANVEPSPHAIAMLLSSESLKRRTQLPMPACSREAAALLRACEEALGSKAALLPVLIEAWVQNQSRYWDEATLDRLVHACGVPLSLETRAALLGSDKGAVAFSSRGTPVAAGVRLAFPVSRQRLVRLDGDTPMDEEIQDAVHAVAYLMEAGLFGLVLLRREEGLYVALPQLEGQGVQVLFLSMVPPAVPREPLAAAVREQESSAATASSVALADPDLGSQLGLPLRGLADVAGGRPSLASACEHRTMTEAAGAGGKHLPIAARAEPL